MRPLHPFEENGTECAFDVVQGSNNQKYVVESPLDLEALRTELLSVKGKEVVTSIAIVLMHSYAYPSFERQVE